MADRASISEAATATAQHFSHYSLILLSSLLSPVLSLLPLPSSLLFPPPFPLPHFNLLSAPFQARLGVAPAQRERRGRSGLHDGVPREESKTGKGRRVEVAKKVSRCCTSDTAWRRTTAKRLHAAKGPLRDSMAQVVRVLREVALRVLLQEQVRSPEGEGDAPAVRSGDRRHLKGEGDGEHGRGIERQVDICWRELSYGRRRSVRDV